MIHNEIIRSVRNELRNHIDENTVATSQRFFKEKIIFYGVRVPVVNRIARDIFKHIRHLDKHEIFALCKILWQSEYIEESFIACNWSYCMHERYTSDDFLVFADWIENYVNNWASCDTLCNHSAGALLEMYPEQVLYLYQWAASPNRWMRRAAAASLIIPAGKGKFLREIFDIASILLPDRDDLVQKGYGWLLKTASETYQQEVFDYVVGKREVMPRTALRYAIEKMPAELKKIAMQKS